MRIPCMLVLIAALALTAAEANNIFGTVMSLESHPCDSTAASGQFRLARELVGEWGYVRQEFDTADPSPDPIFRFVVMARANHLIPIVTGGRVPQDLRDEKGRPGKDYDGTYGAAAAYLGRWLQGLEEKGIRLRYFQLEGELNATAWPAEDYAQWLFDVTKAMRAVDPRIQFAAAGMAGSAADYFDRILKSVPELADSVDIWSLHLHLANHPPDFDKNDNCVRGYERAIEVLMGHGVYSPRIMLSEIGYELGNRENLSYPRVTEELRAKYMVEAFEQTWLKEQAIAAVCASQLADFNWDKCPSRDWVRFDGTKTPVYQAVAAMAKSEAGDYEPSGDAAVHGRITDKATGRPIHNAFVYLVPGIHAAETGADGRYRINGVPPGDYRINSFKDGYGSPVGGRVSAASGGTTVWEGEFERVGLITHGFEQAGRTPTIAAGWESPDKLSHPEKYGVDPMERRSGKASQRITGGKGERSLRHVGPYLSAIPGRVYTAQIWVRAKDLNARDRPGATLTLAFADSHGADIAGVRTFLSAADSTWQPLYVTAAAPEGSRRLKVVIGVEANSGAAWFDDLYVHFAEDPLPASWVSKPAGCSVSGKVIGRKGRPLMGATVSTVPGNFFALTGADGRYEIYDLPAGEYSLRAFYPEHDLVTDRAYLSSGKAFVLDFNLSTPRPPDQLLNHDFEESTEESKSPLGWKRWGMIDGVIKSANWHFPIPPKSGDCVFGSAASDAMRPGGLYQTISVHEGREYEVSAWVYTMQRGGTPGDVANRLGVDAEGEDSPKSAAIKWSDWTISEGRWTEISLRVKATSDRMTVLLEHQQLSANQWNINCSDNVTVRELP